MNQIRETLTNGRDAEHFKIVIVGGGLVRLIFMISTSLII